MTLLIIEKTVEMLLLICMGILVYKIGILDDHTASRLSPLLLTLVQPLVIITSYQKEFQIQLLYGLLLTLLASALSYLITITASHFILASWQAAGPHHRKAYGSLFQLRFFQPSPH